MNLTTNENETLPSFIGASLFQRIQSKFPSIHQSDSSNQQTLRSSHHERKTLSYLQIIEICSLCFILIEHTIIFILTFRKKTPKRTLFDTK